MQFFINIFDFVQAILSCFKFRQFLKRVKDDRGQRRRKNVVNTSSWIFKLFLRSSLTPDMVTRQCPIHV